VAKSSIIEPKPDDFLIARISIKRPKTGLTGLCIGYEIGQWRAEQFAQHIIEWLPEFSLNWSEREKIHQGNCMQMLKRAAANVYTTKKFKNRGEFGEIFLHAAIRQEFSSSPVISKIYYKSARNDTVKGFDAVHVVKINKELELWLGEAKFYKKYKNAATDVLKEISKHTVRDYLKDEFALIIPKMDSGWPHYKEIKKLISSNTSLDVVFKRACIPILLTYNSDCISKHNTCSSAYITEFIKEIQDNYNDFVGRSLPTNIYIHLFLLPLHSKDNLIALLDKELKRWQ
jgi:hypothetical protein